MADRLTAHLAVWLAALACAASPAAAQSLLADPTRPPAGLVLAGENTDELAAPVLQSVIIPERGKPWALIGGRPVRLGERYGDSRLIRLSEREAVLDGPDGTTRLLLTPAVEKTNAAPPPKTAAPRRAQGGGKP